MTNAEAKQEAIKKAYGDLYEPNYHHINEDGLIHYISESNLVGLNIYGNKFHSNGSGSFVLKELWDIQNNNGWIRIEPDGSNLPADNILFKSYNEYQDKIAPNILDRDTIISRFKLKTCTHYKPIIPELKPIY